MQHPRIDTVFLGPRRGREEQTTSVHVLLVTRTKVSHSPGILASKDNPASSFKVGGTRNMLSAPVD